MLVTSSYGAPGNDEPPPGLGYNIADIYKANSNHHLNLSWYEPNP